MALLVDQPENAAALSYLSHGRSADEAGFGPPAADVDRHHLGTHPAVVDRLWDELNGGLPADARHLIYDGPALVHPSGTILAAAIGTQYVLRLLPDDAAAAVAAGAEVVHQFRTVGTTLDLRESFGPDWVFGARDEREGGWLLATYRAIDAARPSRERASL